jgi:hypothetical protein
VKNIDSLRLSGGWCKCHLQSFALQAGKAHTAGDSPIFPMNQQPAPVAPAKCSRPWILIAVIIGIVLLLGYGINNVMQMASRKVGENMMERMIEKSTGDKADVDFDDSGNMKLTTHEGTFATGQKLPADWPTDAPVYAGADVQYSASVNPTNGKPGKAVVLMTQDDSKAVESFYEAELVKQGWVIAEDAHTPVGYVVSATKDTRILSLMVGGAEGRTTITLGVSEAE